MLCADMVEVSWKDHSGNSSTVTGLLEDISPSGACLQLDDAAPLGAEIRWRSRQNEFVGRVRYCLYREIGYFIGVEFLSGSKWSERSFRPQHLLDLQKFMA
jgi:ribulose bisphosphate carboxylase small subunit